MPITINLHMHTDEPSDVSDFLEMLRSAELLDQCHWSIEAHPADDDADRAQAILAAALKARDDEHQARGRDIMANGNFGTGRSEGPDLSVLFEAIDSDPTPPHGIYRASDFDEVNGRCDDLDSRLTDTQARFRGLLADFEGSCTQIADLQRRTQLISDHLDSLGALVNDDDALCDQVDRLREWAVSQGMDALKPEFPSAPWSCPRCGSTDPEGAVHDDELDAAICANCARPVVHYRYTSTGKTRMHGTDLNCLTTGFHEWTLTSGSAKLRTHQCDRCGLIRHEVAAGS